MSEIRLSNARVILADEVVQGSVTMADGLIKDISTGPDTRAGAVDCDGDYLAPGLVELHTDNLERHITPRPRVRQHIFDALLAHDGELASTGITTVFDALRIGSVLRRGDIKRREPELRPLRRRNAWPTSAREAGSESTTKSIFGRSCARTPFATS